MTGDHTPACIERHRVQHAAGCTCDVHPGAVVVVELSISDENAEAYRLAIEETNRLQPATPEPVLNGTKSEEEGNANG